MATEPGDWDAIFAIGAGRKQRQVRIAKRVAAPAREQHWNRRLDRQLDSGLKAPEHWPPAVGTAQQRTNPRRVGTALQTYTPDLASRLENDGQHEYRRGFRVIAIALGIAGVAAGLLPLSGGIVTGGTLVSASSVKTVQPAIGGTISELLAGDGMKVQPGQVLVRLDATIPKANLLAITQRLREVRATIDRLETERNGKAGVAAQSEPKPGDDDEAAEGTQLALLQSRVNSRRQQIVLLKDHIAQLELEQSSALSQLMSKKSEMQSVATELASLEPLFEQHLVTISRVTAMRRDKAQLEGAIAALQASIAGDQSRTAEAKMLVEHFREEFQSQVLAELSEAKGKDIELTGQSAAAEQQLKLMDIRAPQSGIVHELAVHTVGGVVTPGEALMLISPDNGGMQVETDIQPKDIDQITLGQPVALRFAAFDRNRTPELHGTVSYVSPGAVKDGRTNALVYHGKVAISDAEIRRLGDLHLVSGMPVELVLETQSRTLLSYLFKPLTDQIYRSFRGR